MFDNAQQIFQSIVLHAHLPYVRHPEYPKFFEENWLFEAISECYLPLIEILHKLDNDSISGKITFTLTPTLTSMLQDKILVSRYSQKLSELVKLSAKEAQKKRKDDSLKRVTSFYHNHFCRLQKLFDETYNQNIINEFIKLRDSGRIEIIGCSATHALLALTNNKNVIKSQIETGVNSYIETFGSKPRGIWIPECAYTPLISEVIIENGVEYSIIDSHGILHGTPMPKYSVFAPIKDKNGLILFGRDPESSKQVWSSETGYPGDYNYREFYRDLGWDAKIEDIQEYLVSPEIRHDLGLKYFKISGKANLDEKEIYNPEVAIKIANEHGKHFVISRIKQGQRLFNECNSKIHLMSPYDAELFGHWWFEGPIFIESVLRNANNSKLTLLSPSDYIDKRRELQTIDVSISSWGNNGYFETWLNGSNDWIYQELRTAEEKMQILCNKFKTSPTSPEIKFALNQCAREILLAQSSDWSFILTTGTTTEYATKRVKDHMDNFNTIYDMIRNNNVDIIFISELFEKNNIFPNIDYSVFC